MARTITRDIVFHILDTDSVPVYRKYPSLLYLPNCKTGNLRERTKIDNQWNRFIFACKMFCDWPEILEIAKIRQTQRFLVLQFYCRAEFDRRR